MENETEYEGRAKRQYTNENQQTLMRVFEYLAQDILEPKASKEIAHALNISSDQAFRTLWNLVNFGWAEEANNGGYRLSPRMTSISDRLRLELATALKKYLPEV